MKYPRISFSVTPDGLPVCWLTSFWSGTGRLQAYCGGPPPLAVVHKRARSRLASRVHLNCPVCRKGLEQHLQRLEHARQEELFP